MIGLLILACLGAAIGVAVLVYLLLAQQVRRAQRERLESVWRQILSAREPEPPADMDEAWREVLERAERRADRLELR